MSCAVELEGRLSWMQPWAWRVLLGVVVMLLAWPAFAQTGTHAQQLPLGDLTVGFSAQAFSGANRNDIEAAFKAFLVTVGRKRGFDLVARTLVFDEGSAFEAAIRSGKVQLAIIPSWDYLAMDLTGVSDPSFVAVDQQGILEEYILLTRKDAGLHSLAELRGKSIAVLQSISTYMSSHWLETLLLQQQLGSPGTFFGGVEKVAKPSSAVLPVFFGKHNACVVDRAAFDIMQELNPQIGERLQILMTSPPLLDAVLCLSKSGWIGPEHKEATIQGLAELDAEPAGQQILTLFKVRRIARFKSEYLDSIRELKAAHDRQRGALKTGAGSAPPSAAEGRNSP